MKTFFDYTVEVLSEMNKGQRSVAWVGNPDGGIRCTWGEFARIARFPFEEETPIVSDLTIRFTDGGSLRLQEGRWQYVEGVAKNVLPLLTLYPFGGNIEGTHQRIAVQAARFEVEPEAVAAQPQYFDLGV